MRPFATLLLASSLLFAGCSAGDDSKKDNPAPDALVQVRLSNVGRTGSECSAFLLNTSVFANDKSQAVRYWSHDLEAGTATYEVGRLKRGATYYLSVTYDTGGRPNYPRPTAGQYIEGELLVDGKSQGTVRCDAASFDDPSKYWGDLPGERNRVGNELKVAL